ncbi:ArsA family ATPase [Kineosporia sp. NBRC 101731]|uniref:ArsA family ATPase n=1 Tax=Kineosporia sp. NBRC 101731 TaxID=3032199 RepID=UPI0024A13F0F|nr:ArsA family ATPase [Kineosporia sp. NBRC 101731]GLY32860.1 arsenic-transporting ATPase [Kineosporia sp. NBRC 101731]
MRLVVFTGRGGVGKTTTAAATAAHAASRGVKTLVMSADPAPALADQLGLSLGPQPSEVGAGLFASQMDPHRLAQRFWESARRPALDALDDLGVDPLAAEDLADLPGLDDLLALLAVREETRDGPWDLVVVDCAPSAAAFRLLATPGRLGRLLARLLPMERRLDRLSARGMAGDPLVDAVDRFAGELAGLRSMLTDGSTSVRLVMTPEASALTQTRRLFTALTMSGFPVDAVVVNRIFPTGPPASSMDLLMDQPMGWQNTWRRSQEAVLADIVSSFEPVPVLRMTYAPAEPQGLEQLADLGLELYGNQPGPVRPGPLPPRVERTDTGFSLSLAMPLARRETLDLGRRGDDLVVTADGYRQVLPLPGVLRRCRVENATLREGTLAVAFVPDPAQFPSRWM